MSTITCIKIMTTLATLFLASCASTVASDHWLDSHRNCPLSGQAYTEGIPLASRSEHAQAELFAPLDPANCVIYVVRSDWAGRKSARAKVFVYEPGKEPPALPPDYWPLFGLNSLAHPRWSERHMNETPQELRKAEISARHVYATWELPPGSYVIDASLDMGQPFARAVITCSTGHNTFWNVTPKSMLSTEAKLNELDETEGKAQVLHRLRSAGMQPGGPLSKGWIADRICPAE